MKIVLAMLLWWLCAANLYAQQAQITGVVYAQGKPLPGATLAINNQPMAVSNKLGSFSIAVAGEQPVLISLSAAGYHRIDTLAQPGLPLSLHVKPINMLMPYP
jgi:hypothetical protein